MWQYNHYNDPPKEDELYHFGIKGQKWGLRRFQNEDGSLTPEGKKRYGTVENLNAAREKRASRLKKAAIAAGAVAGAAALGYGAYKGINALKARNAASKTLKVGAGEKIKTLNAGAGEKIKISQPGSNSVYGGGTSSRTGLQSITGQPGSNSVYGGLSARNARSKRIADAFQRANVKSKGSVYSRHGITPRSMTAEEARNLTLQNLYGTTNPKVANAIRVGRNTASKVGNAVSNGFTSAKNDVRAFGRGISGNSRMLTASNQFERAGARVRNAYIKTDAFVRRNPYAVAGGVGAAGAGIGVAATRRRRKKK